MREENDSKPEANEMYSGAYRRRHRRDGVDTVLTIVVISLYIHPFGQILIKRTAKESSRMRPPGFRVFEVRISV